MVQDIRYIGEYISNLQIHQHPCLTRRVFFRHNFHHWSSSLDLLIICIYKSSSSSSHLRLQVIFIFRYGSSLDLDHHWSSSLDLDHHSIWIIIIGSGSSLVIITGSGSSLDLDHHCCIIITGSSWVLSHDSSRHRKFYRASFFSCWF